MEKIEKKYFKISEVVQEIRIRTGLTVQQPVLRSWEEELDFWPKRNTYLRLYTTKNIADLAVIAQLRNYGFGLKALRIMLNHDDAIDDIISLLNELRK